MNMMKSSVNNGKKNAVTISTSKHGNVIISMILVLLLSFVTLCQSQPEETNNTWSFNVLADWHMAESYITNTYNSSKEIHKLEMLQYIKDTYKGEVMIIPGDTNVGKWDTESFLRKYSWLNGKDKDLTVEEAITIAGRRSYGEMKKAFAEAGFETLLVAVGDHELGGNNWRLAGRGSSRKALAVPDYRKAFAKGLNREATLDPNNEGQFLFNEKIGTADPRPYYTVFNETSYAHVHNQVLFVTVNNFLQVNYDLYNRNRGIGGEGSVTCDVRGAHLRWFEDVLKEGNRLDSIKHIVVQAHVPIIQPVRKVSCSGQFFDHGEKSKFWKLMREYNVDLYFGGEVHSTTVTKDTDSSLLQIVSRGNGCTAFLKVNVKDDKLTVTSYLDQGPLPKYNKNYTIDGEVTIDKKSGEETQFTSSGTLKLLDRQGPVIHTSFEELLPLGQRRVTALKHDDYTTSPVITKITIRDVECFHAFANEGTFDKPYDAQAGNININGAPKGPFNNGIKFEEESRLAFFGVGPHSGGNPMSYAIWFKTNYTEYGENDDMVLIHYGTSWFSEDNKEKNIFTVTLRNGTPMVHTHPTVLTTDTKLELNDGQWHHIAVTMPGPSSKTSRIKMFIDGKKKDTKLVEETPDESIFFLTSGRVSLGGLGYSHEKYDGDNYSFVPYFGEMDEFYVWARTIGGRDINRSMRKRFTAYNSGCDGEPKVKNLAWKECKKKCQSKKNCWGYERTEFVNGNTQCHFFVNEEERPTKATSTTSDDTIKRRECGILE